MARTKRKVVITARVALDRIDRMIRRIETDTQIALEVEQTLEVGNRIGAGPPPLKRPGAEAYNCIAQSMAMHLALCLARIFDPGAKRFHDNKKTIASIPLLMRLLRQRRCQTALAVRARAWTPHLHDSADLQERGCRRSIGNALKAYTEFRRSPSNRAAQTRLLNFRNSWLAHTKMDDLDKKRPTYADLFKLTDLARDIVQSAMLAVHGNDQDMSDMEKRYAAEAERFWTAALKP